jgi:hypothetical protein
MRRPSLSTPTLPASGGYASGGGYACSSTTGNSAASGYPSGTYSAYASPHVGYGGDEVVFMMNLSSFLFYIYRDLTTGAVAEFHVNNTTSTRISVSQIGCVTATT